MFNTNLDSATLHQLTKLMQDRARLDLKQLGIVHRQINLGDRLATESNRVEAARLRRNLAASELDHANLDYKMAKITEQIKVLITPPETAPSDMMSSLLGLIFGGGSPVPNPRKSEDVPPRGAFSSLFGQSSAGFDPFGPTGL